VLNDYESAFAFWSIWGSFAIFFVFIFFIVAVVLYVLVSMGLYKMALNQRLENPWLAWIPIADMYILGKLIKNLRIQTYEIPHIELVLPLGALVVAVLGNIPLIGWLINLAYIVLSLFALFKLYKMYKPEQAVLYLVLSIVLPFMGPIFIFMLRNNTPVAQ
jgi:hypothetical protein